MMHQAVWVRPSPSCLDLILPFMLLSFAELQLRQRYNSEQDVHMHSQEAYVAVCVGKEHSVNNKALTYTEYFQLIKC